MEHRALKKLLDQILKKIVLSKSVRDQKKNIQTSPSTICFASDFQKKLKKPFKKIQFQMFNANLFSNDLHPTLKPPGSRGIMKNSSRL
jgi:hypothetical protein